MFTTRDVCSILVLFVAGVCGGCHHSPSENEKRGAYFEGREGSVSSQMAKKGGGRERETIPTSARTYAETLRMAQSMVAGAPSLRVAQVAATGSMRPYLGEASLVILEVPDTTKLKVGAVISYSRAGAEFIHVIVARTGTGFVTKGSAVNAEELVPFDRVTGSVMGVLYFDPETAPFAREGIPLLLAASGDELPPKAGSLRITGATMLTGFVPAPIYPSSDMPAEYAVTLERETSLGLEMGVPEDSTIPLAHAAVSWSESVAGQTIKFRFYHVDAPETGEVVLFTTFAE